MMEIGSIDTEGHSWCVESSNNPSRPPIFDLYFMFSDIYNNSNRPNKPIETPFPSEVKYLDFRSKVYYGFFDGLRLVGDALAIGIGAGIVLVMAGGVGAGAISLFNYIKPNSINSNISSVSLNLIKALGNCAMGYPLVSPLQQSALELFGSSITGASLMTAAGRLVFRVVKSFFAYREPTVRPIFSENIEGSIFDILATTHNCQKTGGNFQNVLLYGPPGTGKTMLSRWIAENSGMNYVMLSGSDLLQFVKTGQHVAKLNRLFDEARNGYAPTIIFIDEAETLCADREISNKTESIELINAFLTQTGEPSKNVMVILATNRYGALDPGVVSRLDFKIAVGLPETDERRKILKAHVESLFSVEQANLYFPHSLLTRIANQTEGFSGRTLAKMINHVRGLSLSIEANLLTPEFVEATIDRFIQREQDAQRLVVNE